VLLKKSVVAKPPPINVFTLLVDAFLSGFLNKNLLSNSKGLNTYHHNTYKCIAIFRFLHTKRVCCLLDFSNKNLRSSSKHLNTFLRTIYN